MLWNLHCSHVRKNHGFALETACRNNVKIVFGWWEAPFTIVLGLRMCTPLVSQQARPRHAGNEIWINEHLSCRPHCDKALTYICFQGWQKQHILWSKVGGRSKQEVINRVSAVWLSSGSGDEMIPRASFLFPFQ